MVQAMIKNKKMLILLGAVLVLLLAVACVSDENGNGDSVTGGGVSAADLSTLLSSAGGAQGLASVLRSGSNSNTGIWVSGTGKASGTPDLGVLSLGVESLADTASQARGEAAVAIDQIIAVLRRNAIEDRDIQTSHFNISPRYNTQEVTKCTDRSLDAEPTTGGPAIAVPAPEASADEVDRVAVQEFQGTECRVEFERVLIGYQVTNTLTVRVRDLDNMGGIIDGVTDAAGNLTRVNRVSFTIEDTKPLQNEAREEAIADMLAKANAMARLAGVELGNLVYLTESGGAVPQSFARLESAAAFGFAADQSTTILAGEMDVNVNVQGVFGIVNPGN